MCIRDSPCNELDKFAVFFLEKCTLGKIIGKYIVLHEGDKCLMVLRPYQFYAVETVSYTHLYGLHKEVLRNNNIPSS